MSERNPLRTAMGAIRNRLSGESIAKAEPALPIPHPFTPDDEDLKAYLQGSDLDHGERPEPLRCVICEQTVNHEPHLFDFLRYVLKLASVGPVDSGLLEQADKALRFIRSTREESMGHAQHPRGPMVAIPLGAILDMGGSLNHDDSGQADPPNLEGIPSAIATMIHQLFHGGEIGPLFQCTSCRSCGSTMEDPCPACNAVGTVIERTPSPEAEHQWADDVGGPEAQEGE